LGHQYTYETKYYQFRQAARNDYFGDGFMSVVWDKANLKTTHNQLNARFSNTTLGTLTGHIDLYQYNYFFNSVLQTETQLIQSQLKDSEVAVGAKYNKQI